MKKQIIIAIAMLVSTASFAQNSKLKAAKSAIDKGDYKVAYSAIEAASKHKKTKDNPKTWALRAQVLSGIQTMDLGSIVGVEVKEGEVLETLMKAKELDTSNSYTAELQEVAQEIVNGLHNEGVVAYSDDKDYEKAAEIFSKKIELSKMFLPDTEIDDINYLVVGSSYANLEQPEKAMPYYLMLVEKGYNEEGAQGIYNYLIQEYDGKDDEKYLDILSKAQITFPENSNYKLLEIDHYQKTGQIETKLSELEAASAADPDNENLLLILSEVYKTQGNTAKEEELLKKVLALNPENDTANFNLGVAYFNQAVVYNDEINNMMSNTSPEYVAKKAKRDELANKAFPMFEKVYKQQPNSAAVLNAMYQYYSMMGDKVNRDKFGALLDQQ